MSLADSNDSCRLGHNSVNLDLRLTRLQYSTMERQNDLELDKMPAPPLVSDTDTLSATQSPPQYKDTELLREAEDSLAASTPLYYFMNQICRYSETHPCTLARKIMEWSTSTYILARSMTRLAASMPRRLASCARQDQHCRGAIKAQPQVWMGWWKGTQ